MAKFYQTLEGKYDVETYQATKNIYDWIMNAINLKKYPDLKIVEKFFFDIGKQSCSCDNVNEFANHAYGADSFSLIFFDLYLSFNQNEHVYIKVNHDGTIVLTADSNLVLSELIQMLDSLHLASSEENDSIANSPTQNQNNNVNIQGNGNTYINAFNIDRTSISTETTSPDRTPKWNQYLDAILQNIIANGVWYLIAIGITALLTHLLTK